MPLKLLIRNYWGIKPEIDMEAFRYATRAICKKHSPWRSGGPTIGETVLHVLI
jgi:hypothetical protein